MASELDPVWKALADATRREILDFLRAGPRTTTDIVERFPDLTRFGVEETRTPQELDNIIRETKGTVMVVVNSVCGCAAGLARPAIGMALKHATIPNRVVTVFAGADIEATDRARGYFKGYFPSSPAVGILQE